MNTVDLNKAKHTVADQSPYGSRDFKDISTKLWRDSLNFNIFDVNGYLTEDAKDHIRANNIKKKDDEAWGDAILNHAEKYEMGYQCDKAPKKRSDVKFSGSMILSAYIKDQQ